MTGAVLALAAALGPARGGGEVPASTEDCPRPVEEYLAEVQERRSREAYFCLARRDDARDALLTAIAAADPEDRGFNALTRALAVHLMQRLDRRLAPEEVRALQPADRRLLRDAVKARRGRRSPAPEHDRVFAQFDWYRPDDGYTDGRLDDVDRANIALLDRPPPEEGPEEEAEEAAGEGGGEARRACGCGAAGGGGLVAALAGLLLAAGRRGRATAPR